MNQITKRLCLITFIFLFDVNAYAQSNLMFNMPVDGFTETSDPSLNESFSDCQDDACAYKSAKNSQPLARLTQKNKENFTVILDGDHWPE